jgi:hypothetical protein
VVGASALTTTSNGLWSAETVWNSGNGVGGSGGISPTYPIPSWQLGINMTTNGGSTSHRNVPDVAMVGNNVSVIWNNGHTNTYNGTSCSTPLWAAFAALANQQAANFGQPTVGFLNPAIYGIGLGTNYLSCFHDISTGNNTRNTSPSRYYATPGYDLCTGWGTPAGQALIDALEPPTFMVISPATGLSANGPPGGPFTPSAQSLSISNNGSTTLSWSLTSPSAWLTVTPTNGMIPVGGSAATVTVGINSTANALTSGVYSAALAFTDATTQLTRESLFTLQISASLVLNGGFETGNFTNWILAGDQIENTVTSLRVTPHSGNYCAIFSQYGSVGYLSQAVPTLPGQAYLLAFWLANTTGSTPNQFLVNWITSPANTNTLISQANLGVFGWTNEQFVVVSTETNSILQFGFRQGPQYFGLDDVSLVPVPTPVLTAVAAVNGTMALSWVAFPGLKYQVQFTTNFTQSGWIDLGSPITASNAVGAAIISIGTDWQRFYRVLGPQ